MRAKVVTVNNLAIRKAPADTAISPEAHRTGAIRVVGNRQRKITSQHRAAEPENQGGDTVAPQGQPQSDLFLRKLQDALHDDAKAKDLENSTGLSRSQIEQFAKKYHKLKSDLPGPGRNLTVKPGEETTAKPSANLSGLSPSTRFGSVNRRAAGSAPQDEVRDNVQGMIFQPPAEYKGRWEGYKNRLRNVAAPKSAGTKKAQ